MPATKKGAVNMTSNFHEIILNPMRACGTGGNRLGRFPEAASDELVAGHKRNFQIFEPLDLLPLVAAFLRALKCHRRETQARTQ